MARKDAEAWLLDAISIVKSNLNTKIAAINAEKGDSVSLATVAADAYYYRDLGTETPTQVPAVIFHDTVESEATVGSSASQKLRLTLELYTSDLGLSGSEKIVSLTYRYRRALREVLLDAWQNVPGLKATDLPDVHMPEQDGNYYSVAVGFEFHIV